MREKIVTVSSFYPFEKIKGNPFIKRNPDSKRHFPMGVSIPWVHFEDFISIVYETFISHRKLCIFGEGVGYYDG